MKGIHACTYALTVLAIFGAAEAVRPNDVRDATLPPGYDVRFAAPDGPVVIRFVLLMNEGSVADRPLAQVWDEFLEAEFHRFDTSGDGQLDATEKRRIPQTRLLAALELLDSPNMASSSLLQQDPLAKVKNPADWRAYAQRIGFTAFRIVPAAEPDGGQRFVEPFAPGRAGETLFQKLDRDLDGQLSASELEAAADVLRRDDLDRDESITAAELTPLLGRASMAEPAVKPKRPKRFVSLPAATTTSPKPDVIITIRCGELPAGEKPIEVRSGSRPDIEIMIAGGAATLTISGVKLEIDADRRLSTAFSGTLKESFRAADSDSNGYLDKNEADRLDRLGALFRDLDANRDNKVFIEEFVNGLTPLFLAAGRQYQLSIDEGGPDFLALVDGNQDGRLTAREIRRLPQTILAWDRNADGRVSPEEFPQKIRLNAAPGNRRLVDSDASSRRIVRPMRGQNQRPALGGSRAPIWFQSMDRNRDGDISRQEFLGTEDAFKKLDRNGDGLIDAEEAAAAN